MAQRLDTAVNISILATCAIVVVTLVPRFMSGWRSSPRNETSQLLVPGDRIPALVSNRTDKSLVLAWRSDCRYCAESAPFYRKLAQLVRERRELLSLVVMTTDAEQPSVDALQRLGIPVSAIVSISPEQQRQQYRVPGTPTLIAMDSRGLVEKVWFGKLSDDRQREVFEFISQLKQ